MLPITILLHGVLNLGLHFAALQREDLDHEGLSRLFWFSSWFNLLLVGGMALLGPLMALLYDDPRVVGVTLVWAVALYVMNVGAFHETLLKRQMRFAALVSIHTIAMAIGILVAIEIGDLAVGRVFRLVDAGRVEGAPDIDDIDPETVQHGIFRLGELLDESDLEAVRALYRGS